MFLKRETVASIWIRYCMLQCTVRCGLSVCSITFCGCSFIKYKKAVLSQRWPRDAPYIWVPWIFGTPDYAHGYYSQHFSWTFVPIDPINVPAKFEVRSFTRSWDNIGVPKKNWAVPGYAHAPFFPKFLMGIYSDWPYKCTCQIRSL